MKVWCVFGVAVAVICGGGGGCVVVNEVKIGGHVEVVVVVVE